MIPVFVLHQLIGLYDAYFGLSLIYQVQVLPFSIWMLRNFLAEIPPALDEAAQMEGRSLWRILVSIYIPSAGAGFAATAVLNSI